tara:strand:+ start:2965 stop:3372 length:408 start_codon:yes stop_codon:yes gene_type:complete
MNLTYDQKLENYLDELEATDRYYSELDTFEGLLEDPPFSNKAKERKDTPVFSGVLAYFPLAIKEVSKASKAGNDQHNPGTSLHWDRSKSGDELDALTRHLLDHSINPVDDDGVLHLTKVCWRAMAALQKELEKKQ